MKYLKIQNNGELDIRLVALMGGTTKQNDKFKIGKFGTGLKYTLAFLYRNNVDFKCFSGTNEVKIHIERETIGESEFEIICINGNRTSITTQMGAEWTSWMIIRELWCNALDEGGSFKENIFAHKDNSDASTDKLIGEENKTTFYIQITPEINEVLENWDSYFIHRFEPIWENDMFAIYPSKGNLKLYKHGVLIYQQIDTKSVFNYDIKSATINELREFKGIVAMEIMSALKAPSTEVINYFFSNVTEEHYEGRDMDYDWYITFGSVWKEALEGQRIVDYDTVRYVEQNGIDAEQVKKAIALPKNVYKALVKTFEGIGALRMSDSKVEFYEGGDPRLEEKINEVLATLKLTGYEISPELKLTYGIFADKKTNISLNSNKKELMISVGCGVMSDDKIASLIIEKNELFVGKFDDLTRSFQNHLIKIFTNKLFEKIDNFTPVD